MKHRIKLATLAIITIGILEFNSYSPRINDNEWAVMLAQLNTAQPIGNRATRVKIQQERQAKIRREQAIRNVKAAK